MPKSLRMPYNSAYISRMSEADLRRAAHPRYRMRFVQSCVLELLVAYFANLLREHLIPVLIHVPYTLLWSLSVSPLRHYLV